MGALSKIITTGVKQAVKPRRKSLGAKTDDMVLEPDMPVQAPATPILKMSSLGFCQVPTIKRIPWSGARVEYRVCCQDVCQELNLAQLPVTAMSQRMKLIMMK